MRVTQVRLQRDDREKQRYITTHMYVYLYIYIHIKDTLFTLRLKVAKKPRIVWSSGPEALDFESSEP